MTRQLRGILIETLVLLVVGGALALLANQLSPRGLSLTRDYFPPAKQSLPVVAVTNGLANAPAAQTSTESSALAERLRSRGLGMLKTKEVEELFRSPDYEQESVVFVDARNDEHYQEGHIPGAYQYDRYYPEGYLSGVLPACLTASRVVVYCTGGKCEDSELAAEALIEAGIPPGKLFVYVEGITEWKAEKLPLEIGGRKSGVLQGQPQ